LAAVGRPQNARHPAQLRNIDHKLIWKAPAYHSVMQIPAAYAEWIRLE
jgi:hypothetical protein